MRALWGPFLTSLGVRQGFLEEVAHQSWVLSMAHITDVQVEAQSHVYFRVCPCLCMHPQRIVQKPLPREASQD